MHRRSFVTMLAAAPFAAFLPGREMLVPSAERRYRSRSRESGPVDVEVLLAPDERRARGWRNREAHDPFDGMVGELYISDASRLELPADLPGTATTYETVVGVAAQRGVVHVGGFRRGLYVWTVRVHGGPEELIAEAGEAIAAKPLPEPMDVRLVPALIADLLPDADDFSIDLILSDE